MADNNGLTLKRILPWLLLVGGIIALISSFALSIEKFNLIKNPHYVPVCNLNPIFSCSKVTQTPQAEAFGLPNPFLGIAGYAAVAAIGLALLAGAQFKKWFWRLVNVGLLLATVFLTWLQFETIYRIGALCIFCMITWAATIPVFWYLSLFNLREGNISLPKRLRPVQAFILKHHGDILILWFLILTALILKRFWYYFGNL
jgi:uncharacterized membrane protein